VTEIKVFDLLQRRALITRESAHVIEEAMRPSIADHGEVVLDFSGVDAVTPSFVDEILGIIGKAVSERPERQIRVVFLNSPTRLSTKFAAVGRGHGAQIVESNLGVWEMTIAQ